MINKHDIEIILCRPEGSLNIGAVCRAMKNMSFNKLKLIAPIEPDESKIKQMALKAFHIYQDATTYSGIDEAIIDRNYIVGVTRRVGTLRKKDITTPSYFASSLSEIPISKISILFGNEKDGLTDKELAYCHRAITIETDSAMPSLNLSHAVQLICYEIYKNNYAEIKSCHTLTIKEIDEAVVYIDNLLLDWGYYKRGVHNKTKTFLHDLLGRVQYTRDELNYFISLLLKIRYQKSLEEIED